MEAYQKILSRVPGFKYPKEYQKLIALGLVNFEFWHLLRADEVHPRMQALHERYPQRQLIPFARRKDNDDLACFEVGKADRVQIIHDFSSPGFEQRGAYRSFWDWYRAANEEMIAYGEYFGILSDDEAEKAYQDMQRRQQAALDVQKTLRGKAEMAVNRFYRRHVRQFFRLEKYYEP